MDWYRRHQRPIRKRRPRHKTTAGSFIRLSKTRSRNPPDSRKRTRPSLPPRLRQIPRPHRRHGTSPLPKSPLQDHRLRPQSCLRRFRQSHRCWPRNERRKYPQLRSRHPQHQPRLRKKRRRTIRQRLDGRPLQSL